ncbi:MAG: hypothetical protein IKP88_07105 [Lachnospiraceae bacterium]|nr:hypothetical protein [Erysipelotrichaceae bacterium]MBR4342457.1 hypothetical protein [Lachnospiraceae bacterium]
MTNYTTRELTHIIDTTSFTNQTQTFNYYVNLYNETRDVRILQKTVITIKRYASFLINVL